MVMVHSSPSGILTPPVPDVMQLVGPWIGSCGLALGEFRFVVDELLAALAHSAEDGLGSASPCLIVASSR